MSKKNLGLHEESCERLRTRRLVYLILAILCSIMPLISPIFRFGSDQGIIYERTYEMTLTKIQTLLIENTTGIVSNGAFQPVIALNSILALYIVACIVLFFMNFSYRRYTMWGCYVGAVIGVLYYILVTDCGLRASDDLCASLWPNWSVFFPALSMEFLLLTKLNIEKDIHGDY